VARASDLLSRVAAQAALLDEAALASLANRGLVRRARKDLEQAPPRLVGEHEGHVRLVVEEWQVDVAERVADSRCSCPARGACRHVIAALLHLAGLADRAEETAPCGTEVLDVTEEELRRFAGSALFRRALTEVARGLEVECRDGSPFLARIPRFEVECRFLPAGGLAGMLCSCHAEGACLHRVAVVLAWQVQQGRRVLGPADQALLESSGAPRTRQEVRAAVQATLAEMVSLGLSRLSPGMAQRLATLGVSAHGVDLPRLERLLHGLADEVQASLRRDALASTPSMLGRAARIHALCIALETPRAELVGRHRSRYDALPELELMGVGAQSWRTRSGYAGLTVWFHDVRSGGFCTWSEARPVAGQTFDPRARAAAPGPWTGCESPLKAARSHVRLRPAWRSPARRISGRESSHLIVLGPTAVDTVPAVDDWSVLAARAPEALSFDLGEPDETGALVVLAPSAWGSVTYDSIHQESRVAVLDAQGRALPLVLAHAPGQQQALEALEAAATGVPPRVFGRLFLLRGRLVVHPVSLLAADGVRCLGLDGAPDAAAAIPSAAPLDQETDEPEEIEPEAPMAAGALGDILAGVEGQLADLAEAGSGAYRNWPRLAALGRRAGTAGLGAVADTLERLRSSAEAAGPERAHAVARAALAAAWVAQLTSWEAALEAAAPS
jgi:hypothetical protein